jgi:hypothetical protein
MTYFEFSVFYGSTGTRLQVIQVILFNFEMIDDLFWICCASTDLEGFIEVH